MTRRTQFIRIVIIISIMSQLLQLWAVSSWHLSLPFSHIFAPSEQLWLGIVPAVAAVVLVLALLVFFWRSQAGSYMLIFGEIIAAVYAIAQASNGVAQMWHAPSPQSYIPALIFGQSFYPDLGPASMIAFLIWAQKQIVQPDKTKSSRKSRL